MRRTKRFSATPPTRFTVGEVRTWMRAHKMEQKTVAGLIGASSSFVSTRLNKADEVHVDLRLTMLLIGVSMMYDLPGLPFKVENTLLPTALILSASNVLLERKHADLIDRARRKALSMLGISDDAKAAQRVLLMTE